MPALNLALGFQIDFPGVPNVCGLNMTGLGPEQCFIGFVVKPGPLDIGNAIRTEKFSLSAEL